MMTGGRVVLDTRFAVEAFLPRAREHGCTIALLHGPLVEMLYQLPESPDDADNPITRIMASPFPAHLALDFQRRFGIRGIETWGMTEVTIPIWQPFDEPLRLGSCGRLRSEHFELRIVDPDTDEEMPVGKTGEMVLRPKRPFTMMQGYLRMPEVTLETWRNLCSTPATSATSPTTATSTSSTGSRSGSGGGPRTSPRSRSRSPASPIPASRSARPSASRRSSTATTTSCCASSLPPGAVPDEAELIRHLAGELPHFMVPRYLRYLEALPRTPTGKPQKVQLRTEGVTEDTWDRKAAGISLRHVIQEVEQ